MELEESNPRVPTPEELEKGIRRPRPKREGSAPDAPAQKESDDTPWERDQNVGPGRVYK